MRRLYVKFLLWRGKKLLMCGTLMIIKAAAMAGFTSMAIRDALFKNVETALTYAAHKRAGRPVKYS